MLNVLNQYIIIYHVYQVNKKIIYFYLYFIIVKKIFTLIIVLLNLFLYEINKIQIKQ